MKRAFGAAGVTGVLVAMVSVVLTSILLLPVREPARGTPADYGLPFEARRFQIDGDCTLAAWYLPNPHAGGRTVVVLHGISANKSEMLPQGAALYRLGYNVLLLDQRRHGESTGSCTTYGWLERRDLETVLEKLPDTRQGVVVVGYSMGAAIALQSIDDPRIRAVVADSPFADLESMMRVRSEQWHVPSWPFLPLCEWEVGLVAPFHVPDVSPLRCVAETRKPILLIHGGHDHSVPLEQARLLAAAGRGHLSFWLVPEATHISALSCRPVEYYQRVGAFIENAFGSQVASAP